MKSCLAPASLTLALLTVVPFAIAQKVTIQSDDGIDFTKYKTFKLMEGQLNAKAPALNNDIIRRNIETAIRRRLGEKGLMEVDAKPELSVRYTLGAPRRNDKEFVGVGPYGRVRRINVPYTDGTLVIDLRDTNLKELVWQSVTEDKENDPSKIANHIEDMVKKAFEKYPPKKK